VLVMKKLMGVGLPTRAGIAQAPRPASSAMVALFLIG
jgi:hypothetical protein